MMTKFGSRRMLSVVGLTLASVIILCSLLLDIAWRNFQDYNEQARQLEPRISRLLGIEQSYGLLQQAGEKIGEQLAVLAYPAVKDVETTGAVMQRSVREVMSQAGMTINGSRILPVKVRNGYDKIALSITATGNMTAFTNSLKALKDMTPIVIVETINVKPAKTKRTRGSSVSAQNVLVKFNVLSLRLQP